MPVVCHSLDSILTPVTKRPLTPLNGDLAGGASPESSAQSHQTSIWVCVALTTALAPPPAAHSNQQQQRRPLAAGAAAAIEHTCSALAALLQGSSAARAAVSVTGDDSSWPAVAAAVKQVLPALLVGHAACLMHRFLVWLATPV